jgi:hypothetical protein
MLLFKRWLGWSLNMQRRSDTGQRPRIGVSLDQEDYDWLQSFNEGLEVKHSDSYLVARVIRAARLGGLTLETASTGGVLAQFADWLGKRRKKTKITEELHQLLSEFLRQH